MFYSDVILCDFHFRFMLYEMLRTFLFRYILPLSAKESLQPCFLKKQVKFSLIFRCFSSLNTVINMNNVVFVLGGPGAGKGTQCVKIVEKYGYVHLSAGDLLRAERANSDSKYGQLIDKHIKEGSIVPVEITCALLRQAMEKSGKKCFLIDGFPRNKDNLDGWNKEMHDVANVKMVLFFNCSEEVCVNRCLERGKTSGRTDDNTESLKKRIVTFNESTKPIIEHYQGLQLVKEISAERSPSEVFEDVQKVFEKMDS